MTEMWRSWDDVEAEAKTAGRVDEHKVAAYRAQMRAAQRAYRLAEIRKSLGLTQVELAEQMGVSQKRVSALENGLLRRTELGTVESYVQALGGRIEIIAHFGDQRLVVDSPVEDDLGPRGVIEPDRREQQPDITGGQEPEFSLSRHKLGVEQPTAAGGRRHHNSRGAHRATTMQGQPAASTEFPATGATPAPLPDGM